MAEVVYGFDAADIHQLADALSHAVDQPLYRQFSPMDGDWYCSLDLSAMFKRRKAAQPGDVIEASSQSGPVLHLLENDPEPGRMPLKIAGGGRYLLRATGTPAQMDIVEERLQESRLPCSRLRRDDAE
jgi:hypothetical protein